MPNPKIVFIVGHSNWGKSQTLRAFTGGDRYQQRTHIGNAQFFIRRMSNDDRPESFIKRMESISPTDYPYIIAALCPNFEDESVGIQKILEGLCEKGYQLFFWVMKRKYGTSREEIAAQDISRLREFGEVEIIDEVFEAQERANRFRIFIENTVLG